MVWFGENSYYFDQLREFVPQDALSILERQKEKVSQAIDSQVEQFGQALADHVRKEVERATLQAKDALDKTGDGIKDLLDSYEGQPLDEKKVQRLKSAINSYETQWENLGKNVAGAARAAIKASTGIAI